MTFRPPGAVDLFHPGVRLKAPVAGRALDDILGSSFPGLHGPIRVAQKGAAEADDIRLPLLQDLFRLLRRLDLAGRHNGCLKAGFTDGLTDEPNRNDESYGLERLTRLVRKNRTASCSMICNAVYREVISFLGEDPKDDVTLVVVKRTTPPIGKNR